MAAPKENKYAIGNTGGRPPIFKNGNELSKAIDEYFIYIEGESHTITIKEGDMKGAKETIWDRFSEPATITGLALYLGFCDRQSLIDYQKKEEFSCIIKKARTRVEFEYEKKLSYDKCTGALFALKNMGWKDKQDIDHTTNGENINRVYKIGYESGE